MKQILYCYVLAALFVSAASAQPKQAIICGSFVNGRADTLHLSFFKERFNTVTVGGRYQDSFVRDGKFCFTLPPFDGPAYITLSSSRWPRLYLADYLVEPGDSMYINIDPGMLTQAQNINRTGLRFSGQGAVACTARFTIDSAGDSYDRSLPKIRLPIPVNLDSLLLVYEKILGPSCDYRLRLLGQFKNSLDSLVYQAMRADIYYRTRNQFLQDIALEWASAFSYPDSVQRLEKLSGFIRKITADTFHASPQALYLSKEYTDWLLRKTLALTKLGTRSRNIGDAASLYPEINKYESAIRQKLLTCFSLYLPLRLRGIGGADRFTAYALEQVTNASLREILEEQYISGLAGRKAFPFELTDTGGTKISLDNFRGQVLLLDYWFTGCRPCIELAARLRRLHELIGPEIKWQVLSISADADRSSWLRSVASHAYSSTRDTNLFTGGAAFQHPLLRYYQVNSCPRLMIIDGDGNLHNGNVARPLDDAGLRKLAQEIKTAAGR